MRVNGRDVIKNDKGEGKKRGEEKEQKTRVRLVKGRDGKKY